MPLMTNKTALITGGGSGIGRATAMLFSREGAFSIVLDRDESAARNVAHEIEQSGGKAMAVAADVSSSAQVKAAFERIRERTSKLDVLVNSAGIYVFKNAVTLDEADWDRCMNIDLKGSWLCAKHALPMMIAAGGGSIINISSTHAIRAQGNALPYAVSKGGLNSMTRNMAADFGKDGVRVNTISPGLVFTPLTTGYLKNLSVTSEQITGLQALPVEIQPEDIANAALFLASDLARCITGANLIVDGGRTMQLSVRHDG